jgi:hypothetical protein
MRQTTGGKDETCRLLQTTGGKDNTNNVNETCRLLQTTGGKDKPNIVTDITTRNSAREDEC